MKPIKRFDFTQPADARKFLKGLRKPGGHKIESLTINGKLVSLEAITDEQAMDIASAVYIELYKPAGYYYVEEEIIH